MEYLEETMNFLEELVAEYEEFIKGNIIIKNIPIKDRNERGEIDVLSYNLLEKTLIHYETSAHSKNWEDDIEKFKKKFRWGDKIYKNILKIESTKIKKVVITGWREKENPKNRFFYKETGAELLSIPAFIKEITYEIKKRKLSRQAIPEKYHLLRAMQYAIWVGLKDELKLK